jgi:hypothetical protein
MSESILPVEQEPRQRRVVLTIGSRDPETELTPMDTRNVRASAGFDMRLAGSHSTLEDIALISREFPGYYRADFRIVSASGGAAVRMTLVAMEQAARVARVHRLEIKAARYTDDPTLFDTALSDTWGDMTDSAEVLAAYVSEQSKPLEAEAAARATAEVFRHY